MCDNGWITNPENGKYAEIKAITVRRWIENTDHASTAWDDTAGHKRLTCQFPRSCSDRTGILSISAPKDLLGINLLDQEAVRARKQLFGACYVHTLADIEKPGRNLLWRWTVKDVPNGEIWKLIEPVTYGVSGSHVLPAGESRVIDSFSNDRFEKGVVELFDVSKDPDEEKNVATANPAVVKHLQHDLNEWWQPQTASVAVEPVATAPKKLRVLPVKARRKSSDLSSLEIGEDPHSMVFHQVPGTQRPGVKDNIKWRVQLPGLAQRHRQYGETKLC